MKILYIDTTKRDEIMIGLEIDNKKFNKKSIVEQKQKELCLRLIDQVLKEHYLTPKDLTEIRVNPGPGSFTGIRVGISVANAMGFALKIPINGIIGQIVSPVYT